MQLQIHSILLLRHKTPKPFTSAPPIASLCNFGQVTLHFLLSFPFKTQLSNIYLSPVSKAKTAACMESNMTLSAIENA